MSHTKERKRLAETRRSYVHHGVACGTDYYVTLSFFEDTQELAEVFVKVAKEGSDLAGWCDAWALTLSIALQYGVPWSIMRDKYLHQRFGINDESNPSLLHAITNSIEKVIHHHNSLWQGDKT